MLVNYFPKCLQHSAEGEQNHDSPKYATLACRLFWAEGTQERTDSKPFIFPFYCLKEFREGDWLRERDLLPERIFIWMTHLYNSANIKLLNIWSSHCPVNDPPPLWSPWLLLHSLTQDSLASTTQLALGS